MSTDHHRPHPRLVAARQHIDDQRTLSERWADAIVAAVGSMPFIGAYIGLTVVYCAYNVMATFGLLPVPPFDAYPFIFYTFSVSVLAILMTSLVLLSQNRQAAVESALAHHAQHQTDETHAVVLRMEEMEREVHRITIDQSDLMVDVHALMHFVGCPTTTPDPTREEQT